MAFNKAKALQEAEKSVSQGKTSQAIKQYLQVIEKDPADLGLLNTVGDLYVREKNLPEALKYFHKLADSYTQEGFTVKGVAIYKKISKLDSSNVDVLLKIAELYTVQGLGREAREQYTQAIEFYKKKNQNDKALDVFRKVVALDPENTVYRLRFADFCEGLGKTKEAAQAYQEAAEIALRRGDTNTAEAALKKALNLEAKNPRLRLVEARLALAKNKPDEVETILDSTPELKADPAARQILLDAYLSNHKLDAAGKMVAEVFRANPAETASMTTYVEMCIGNAEFDAALKPLAEVADTAIEQGTATPLIELLRRIWANTPDHIPTLELILRIARKTSDEFTLPEVLEALGNAYVKSGQLEEAERVYQQLVDREPENEQHKKLLQQVLEKQGKAAGPAKPQDLSNVEMALAPESEAAPAAGPVAPVTNAEEAAAVKEALDNCDLFARYGLTDKAFGELDKVLAAYPDQVDIHKRVLELSQKSDPARAARTAETLARIYSERRDLASAKRYQTMAGAAAPAIAPETPEPPPPAPAEPPPTPAVAEFDLSSEFLAGAPAEAPAETPAPPRQAPDFFAPTPEEPSAPAPVEAPIDLSAPSAAETPAPAPVQEFDLSGGWEAAAETVEAPPAEPAVQPKFNFEDSKIEIEYYLDQGFLEEATKALQALEKEFPGDPQVAELRSLVDRRTAPEPKAEEVEIPKPEEAAVAEAAPSVVEEEEWELPTSFAETAPAEAHAEAPSEVEVTPPATEEPAAAPAPPEAVPVEASSGGGLDGLIGDLEASLGGIDTEVPPPTARPSQPAPAASATASAGPASPLSGFLEELGGEEPAPATADDPQTHYDLGVAFREMNLLDEAIGEFQKVVKGGQKEKFPPNFLQACTLLALCFMDKKLPAIAVKWYLRAMEWPELDDEATMALQYDLGVAYEQAGDMRNALEKFSEVYSQNIDYRDVAEKIRLLQTKS